MNETEQMLTSILNCRRVDVHAQKPSLTPDQEKRLKNLIDRRNQGEPLQYLLGNCDFMGIILEVNSNVLIPRPETEILVELALEKAKLIKKDCIRILDLGSGSGNIAIALAQFLDNAYVTSIDISAEALEVSKRNSIKNNVSNKINFIHESMINFLELPEAFVSKFDIIISNPPYIKTDDMNNLPADVLKEPLIALEAGVDGLYFIRRIISNAYKFLNHEGFLFLEIGDDQGAGVSEIFNKNPQYSQVDIINDFNQRNRIACAQLK